MKSKIAAGDFRVPSRIWLVPAFLVPMVLVLFTGAWMKLHQRHHEMRELADLVDDRIRDIAGTTRVVLNTLAGYYQSAGDMDAQALSVLSESVLGQNPFIHAISFQSWIPVGEGPLREEAAEPGEAGFLSDGGGLAALPRLLGDRQGYLPMTFIEPPQSPAAGLLGKDLLSLLPDDRAIRRAIESAEPVALRPLAQLELPSHALLRIQATYHGYQVPAGVHERYRQFSGFFLVAVDLYDQLKGWLPADRGYRLAFSGTDEDGSVASGWKIDEALYLQAGPSLAQPFALSHPVLLWPETRVDIQLPVNFGELVSRGGLVVALLAGLLGSLFFLLWLDRYRQRRIAALAQYDLDRERARAHQTLHAIGDAVLVVGEDWRIQYLNPAAEKMLQVQWPACKGVPLEQILRLQDAEHGKPVADVHACFLTRSQEREPGQMYLLGSDGRRIAIDSRVTRLDFSEGNEGMVIVIRDVSTERELTDRLAYQATHDMLTHLYNRSAFETKIRELLQEKGEGRRHAVIHLGLDRFKLVNDTCGHAAGDELLKQVAGQIREVLRNGDLLARLGGDEFGVLLQDCDLEMAEKVARRILGAIGEVRFRRDDKVFQIHASIGVVPLHGERGSLKEVLMAADLACHVAKEQGRSRIHVHGGKDASIEQHHQQMQWLPRLQEALDADRFELFLQPIHPVNEESGLPVMHEFLIRLRGEDGRMLSPGLFIPAAERYGLMWQIDRWMVENAIAYLKEAEADWDALYTINLSAQTFGDRAFAEFVEMTLSGYGVDAGRVCFELTETAAITDISNARELMQALRELGCSILLDDFGSGLSSFGYLKHLPIDYLKIDGQFVRDITTDPLDEVMVRMCQELANVLGVKTVAEFIENQAILDAVKAIGVDYAQGYHLGRPQPALRPLDREAAVG